MSRHDPVEPVRRPPPASSRRAERRGAQAQSHSLPPMKDLGPKAAAKMSRPAQRPHKFPSPTCAASALSSILERAQRAGQPMQNVTVIPFLEAPRTLTRSVAALAERTNAAFDQAAKALPKSRRLRSPLHALPEVFRNHRFPRRKPPGLSCLARQASQLVTAALLPSPNTSSVPSWTRAEPRQEKRGGSSLDGLGYVRLKRIELQIELSRDSGQSDIAIKTR